MKIKTTVGLMILALAFTTAPVALGATTKASTNPYGAATVDPPAPGTPILTVSKGSVVKKYTLAQLQSMGKRSITIFEPFVNKTQSFNVIALADLFKAAGIKASDKVDTAALNDYIYSNTAANFIQANGYLAVKRNGLDIPYDQGGPIRIIFPKGSKWAMFLDPWNWSLSSISVK